MAKRFRCIKGFLISNRNVDGFSSENELVNIEKDSIWVLEEKSYCPVTGNEIMLRAADGSGWIGINRIDLEIRFIQVE